MKKEKINALYKTATVAVIGIDNKGKTTLWSADAEEMFGYKYNETRGKDLHSLIAPDRYHKLAYAALQKFSTSGEGDLFGKKIEITGRKKGGIEFPVELSLSKFKIQDEWHATAVVQDISERKKWEEELVQAKEKAQESEKLKSAFLANMSHEIRTPMNGIVGFVDLLREGGLSREEEEEYLDLILSSSRHLLTIINDILELAKIEAGQLTLNRDFFNLDHFLVEIHEIFRARIELENKKIELILDKHEKSFNQIYGDPIRIKQVMFNLLGNALKFTHKGSIHFGISENKPGQLTFYVKDTGIGIDPALHEKIFDRFAQGEAKMTRQYGGTGLGLSISKGIVEKMGGRIWVESTPNHGSAFYFSIHLTEKKETPSKKTSDISKKTLSYPGHTVLIVEDTDSNFIVLERMLSHLGIKVIRAKTGNEAIKLCKKKSFSLVFMDIKLPERDGFEVTRQIRAFNTTLPIIAQTAYAMEDDRESAFEAGCNDYIAKPIQRAKLYTTLKKYLHR